MAAKKSLPVLSAGETGAADVIPFGLLSLRLAKTEEGGVSFSIVGPSGDRLYKTITTTPEETTIAMRVASELNAAISADAKALWPPRPDVGVDLDSYDRIIVAFSGGKDSLAAVLYLLALGVDRSRIELWHHDVDGREGSTLMDWPCTRDYCRAFAKALGMPIYFSWKVGGFEGEMDRKDQATARTAFETPDGLLYSGGDGPLGNRYGWFPMVTADLSKRWCSAVLKIDVGATALRNQPRLVGKRTLFVTGERGEESSARARYAKLEPHRSDLRYGKKPRHVDHWRPLIGWYEHAVWAIIERYRINPHPAYRLGWGRVSCDGCIFGNANQFASLRKINPAKFAYLVAKETASGKTIKYQPPPSDRQIAKGVLPKPPLSLTVLADSGTPYEMNATDIAAALSHTFDEPIILDAWTLPSGAFGESAGPT